MRLLTLAFILALAGCAASPEAALAQASGADPVRAAQALLPDYVYPAGDTVRVATFNVEHFVDVYDSPYIHNDREDAPDLPALRQRHALFAEALRAMNADVVALQEVEGEGLIRSLVDSLVPEMGYRFVAAADDADWYQNVVVISRLPLGPLTTFADTVTPIPGFTEDDGRPSATDIVNHRLFAVEVYARPGYTFTLAAAHLKAGRGDRNEAWRAASAALLHAWLGQRYGSLAPEANVFLAGDLNSIPGSPSFASLLNADGALGPVRLQDPLAGSDQFSHPSDDPQRRLDHVLMSAGAAPEVVGAEVVMEPVASPRRLSDHLPVVLTLIARDR